MADEKPPKRLHHNAKPKLGQLVQDKERNLTAAPPGRPPTDPALKATILRCLRNGLGIVTAMQIAGVRSGTVSRWRSEIDEPTGLTFGQLMAQAKATPILGASSNLVARALGRPAVRATKDRPAQSAIKPDLSAIAFFLKHRAPEYQNKPQVVPADAARQIRAFVAEAQLSQTGTDDPNVLQDEDEELDADDIEAELGGDAP